MVTRVFRSCVTPPGAFFFSFFGALVLLGAAGSARFSTSVNVYFNSNNNYCDVYDCTLTSYLNEKVEDKDVLSLCQVQETGTVVHNKVDFDPYIELSFDVPQVRHVKRDVTLILPHRFQHR